METCRWFALVAAVAVFCGCPDSREQILAQRNARDAERQKIAAEEAANRKTGEVPHEWPPVEGQRYPDLELTDLEGNAFKLSSLEGKVILLQPVGTQSPGSVAFSGGDTHGGFAGTPSQPENPSIDAMLTSWGIALDHPDLVRVDVLFYDDMHSPPDDLDAAKAWAEHFHLNGRESFHVLLGGWRYIRPDTLAQIPGLVLIDRDFVLRVDVAGGTTVARVRQLLGELESQLIPPAPEDVEPREPEPSPEDPSASIADLVTRADYSAASAALIQEGETGGNQALERLGKRLLQRPEVVAQLDAWCEATPRDALPFWLRGAVLIALAWDARGSGWAHTVSDDGWKLFRERLDLAQASLEHAVELDPSRPHAAAWLITVSKGLGLPAEQARNYFERAVAADPAFFPTYDRMLSYLMPKWQGSAEELVEFAHASVERNPDDANMNFLVVGAHMELAARSRNSKVYLARPPVAAELRTAFARLQEAFPEDLDLAYQRHTYADKIGDDPAAAKWLETAAKLGHPRAMRDYGVALEHGDYGVEIDREESFRWALRSARAGFDKACADVGKVLADGVVYQPNEKAALAWFRRGAELGNPYSMNWLGIFYERGRGVEADLAEAANWYRQSALRGAKPGGENLAELLDEHPELRQPGDEELVE